jgi:wyosine [tRNA(Phe)-imidazoG37] synthetase (radical SAM superfamily)
MLLSPKEGIIYGPVRSRRLGFSLGINLLTPRKKKCTFDCAYCQYGWTQGAPSDSDVFPSVEEVLGAVDEALGCPAIVPAFLTFSGNGEPTTHPQFRSIVEGVRRLRDRRLPSAKLAVLSNSTRAAEPDIREALALLDVRIMKLDAGTDEVFQRYCRPQIPVTLDAIVAALAKLPNVTVQALFAGGSGGNAEPAHVATWIGKVVAIRPVGVQLYTLDRDWPSRELAPLDSGALHAIAASLRAAGCPASVFARR